MSKIKTLIFDFGDVFINLDKQGALQNALDLFQLETLDVDIIETNMKLETGQISASEFVNFYKTKFPKLSETEILNCWNSILKDFPKYRLEFLQNIAKSGSYKLMLLSNTNDIHIDYVKERVPFYEEFKNCFDVFYLSQEIQLRKPNADIFEFVLKENNLISSECLFIDDTKDNTDTAESLGFHTWNIDETKEDIVDLFEIKQALF